MMAHEIVDVIEAELKKKNIKKKDFYDACDVSAAMMSNWRHDKNFPLMDTLQKISTYLRTNLLLTESTKSDRQFKSLELIPVTLNLFGGTEPPATDTGDGLAKRIFNLDPDLVRLLADFVELAQGKPEAAKRFLSFAVQEIQSSSQGSSQ